MMPKIKTKEDYEIAKHERDIIEGMRINGTLSKAQLITLGIRNDAIAEYEENQKQLPDLSFITEMSSLDFQDVFEFKGYLHNGLCYKEAGEYQCILSDILDSLPIILKYVVKAAESDPEAAELLKDIANVNK